MDTSRLTADLTTARPAPARRRHPVGLHAAVIAGGILGALARAGLDRALPVTGHGWPWSTFVVNLAGTILLGYFVTRLHERLPPSTFPRPLLGTGFCGALTTFSTLQVELIQLARHGHAALAAGYLAASVGGGLLLVYVATVAVRRVRVR
jgi:CrcB protein